MDGENGAAHVAPVSSLLYFGFVGVVGVAPFSLRPAMMGKSAADTPRNNSSACSYIFAFVRFIVRIKSNASMFCAIPVESSSVLVTFCPPRRKICDRRLPRDFLGLSGDTNAWRSSIE